MEVPFELGCVGHSDGDAGLHAVVDAMLGAAGLPDIGTLFPDTDPSFSGKESAFFVREALKLLRDKGLRVYQVDVTLVLERPKLGPFKEKMKRRLSELLEVPEDRVGVKAKSTEGMGFCGKEAVAALASVVLLEDGAFSRTD